MSHSPSLRAISKQGIPNLNRYWNDLYYRRRLDAKYDHAVKLYHSNIDAALIANGTRFPAHWTDAEKQDAAAKIMEKAND